MGDAVQKVSSHLRRVGNTRWQVRQYERRRVPSLVWNGQKWVMKKQQPVEESEVMRLIRKAQKR